MSLNQSIGSLHLETELLENLGLNKFQPTELHLAALYGEQYMMYMSIMYTDYKIL